jgi:hypothetical protein
MSLRGHLKTIATLGTPVAFLVAGFANPNIFLYALTGVVGIAGICIAIGIYTCTYEAFTQNEKKKPVAELEAPRTPIPDPVTDPRFQPIESDIHDRYY